MPHQNSSFVCTSGCCCCEALYYKIFKGLHSPNGTRLLFTFVLQISSYLLLDISLASVAMLVGALLWPSLAASEMQEKLEDVLKGMGLAVHR